MDPGYLELASSVYNLSHNHDVNIRDMPSYKVSKDWLPLAHMAAELGTEKVFTRRERGLVDSVALCDIGFCRVQLAPDILIRHFSDAHYEALFDRVDLALFAMGEPWRKWKSKEVLGSLELHGRGMIPREERSVLSWFDERDATDDQGLLSLVLEIHHGLPRFPPLFVPAYMKSGEWGGAALSELVKETLVEELVCAEELGVMQPGAPVKCRASSHCDWSFNNSKEGRKHLINHLLLMHHKKLKRRMEYLLYMKSEVWPLSGIKFWARGFNGRGQEEEAIIPVDQLAPKGRDTNDNGK